ncbi:2OG-Fe(II) oxygenase family protein [Acidisoma cellulosilytica]|uniref:2OG-Fe(II) oxygenase family protein n=1 Tax=Acidisoma cellulosilyticum TaxID=2802395 RepID=A0A963Z7F1_9PROT|nr:2OG-Fe(II) oxygenase family protein [Acidisoma cellulosilyticum]MCB8883223.1 2OG-Fe(II) oxygenase family protein [Acidisoma cellulosilyticum]
MARVEINIRGLFATPVAAVELPDAPARNAELRRIILDRRASHPSVQASNAGGWHSDRDILDWGGARMSEVITAARGIANQMTADRQGQPLRPNWTVQAWANVNGPGDGNIAHYHPGSFWSGTYYVDDGGCADDPSLGGEFEMIDPRGPGPGMYAPALKFAGEDGASVGSGETIRPRPGLLFIFPSWLFHQVRPYRGDALRISIAFNLGLSSTASD